MSKGRLEATIDDWRSFRGLARDEQRWLAVSMLLLPVVVLVHRCLGLRRVQWVLSRFPRVPAGASRCEGGSIRLARSTWRIVRIAKNRSLCRATCLQQSIFLHWLLSQRGVVSDLRIGVSKRGGIFEAHAWVECLGIAVNESADVKIRFAPFPGALFRVC